MGILEDAGMARYATLAKKPTPAKAVIDATTP